MALSEQRRHRMYRRLEEVLGEEAAGTLIEHLPRATWADLATKAELMVARHDLQAVKEDLLVAMGRELGSVRRDLGDARAETERLEQRLMDRFEKTLAEKLNAQTRALLMVTAGLLLSVASIAFAAFKLA